MVDDTKQGALLLGIAGGLLFMALMVLLIFLVTASGGAHRPSPLGDRAGRTDRAGRRGGSARVHRRQADSGRGARGDDRSGEGGHRVGETLAETRVEIAARRADNESTAAELDARVRHALDVKARFRENPLIFIGLGAGAVFLLAGGPALVFRFAAASRQSVRGRAGLRRPAGADAGLGRHAGQRVPGRRPRRRAMRWSRSWRAGAATRSRTRRRARSWPAPWSMDRPGRHGRPGRRPRRRRA